MRAVLMLFVLVALLLALALKFAGSAEACPAHKKSSKSTVTKCSSYTNINGVTNTSCRTKR